MSSQFIRTKENFVCEKCGFAVEGNGYTNHCPECLWSKHVDIFPGDRAEKCGAEKKNTAVREDNFEMLVQISAENSPKFL